MCALILEKNAIGLQTLYEASTISESCITRALLL